MTSGAKAAAVKKSLCPLYLLLVVFLAGACTQPPPLSDQEQKSQQKELSAFFLEVRMAIKKSNASLLYSSLSSDSKIWIDDIREATRTEPLSFLKNRPFYEVLSILALRIEQRLYPEKKQDPVSILRRTVIEIWPIKKSFLKYSLGEYKIYRDRAEVGLSKAPNTPVFFFTREKDSWKIDMVKTLPLILKGAESIARQKRQTVLEQAVYILEKVGGQEVLPEDLLE
jgi:hypothetical protein